jgi:hypothetical protein
MEWWDESYTTTYFLRGISATLDEAISLAAQHKLAGPGANDPQPDVDLDESRWSIEEVPMNVMLRDDIPQNAEYANAGAVAQYQINGTLIRKLSNEQKPS